VAAAAAAEATTTATTTTPKVVQALCVSKDYVIYSREMWGVSVAPNSQNISS